MEQLPLPMQIPSTIVWAVEDPHPERERTRMESKLALCVASSSWNKQHEPPVMGCEPRNQPKPSVGQFVVHC
jgi:hypothetical protein